MENIKFNDIIIGNNKPTFIIAEMSANHNKDFNRAVRIIEEAYKAGADAIKLQTFTPDTITLNSDKEYFKIEGTIWNGKNLYSLYKEAYIPWEWHGKLKKVAEDFGLVFFSTPFDFSAVDFLEELKVPLYKIASSELIDLPLLARVAKCNKPIILSTGMGTIGEISEAIETIKSNGNVEIILLKCVASYPAKLDEMNLLTIKNMSETFNVITGLSDHTNGNEAAITAVALGACVIEKHLTLSRNDLGPDSEFSMEPDEFKQMVDSIRSVEKLLGSIHYGPTSSEEISKKYRKSLFVAEDIRKGEKISETNIKIIRPGNGLHPRYYYNVIGRNVKENLEKGVPLRWEMLE